MQPPNITDMGTDVTADSSAGKLYVTVTRKETRNEKH